MPNPLRSAFRAVAEGGVELIAAFNRKRLPKADNPFVVGVHAPMAAEVTLRDLPVTGCIPAGLNGRYLKMGANPVIAGAMGPSLVSLGDGMVHGIALRDGAAPWYRKPLDPVAPGCRSAWPPGGAGAAAGAQRHREHQRGRDRRPRLRPGGGGQLPPSNCPTPWRNSATNPFDGTLDGSFTGHPHRDPLTGEHHAIAYDGSVWDTVRHVVLSAEGKVIRDVPIAVQHGPCIHDCAFTARFAVVLDLPVTFSMRAVLEGHLFPFRWNPAHPARVGLLPRQGGDVIWCDVEPCFVFHVANAFDSDDGKAVLDVIAYSKMFASGGSGLDGLGQFERWTVDPVTRQVGRRVIDTTPQEFPRVDERRFGQGYQYAYTVSTPPDGNPQLVGATKLFKHDLETGSRLVHDFGEGRVPGEFVFVPAAPGAGEDEGWLLGLVVVTATDTTELAILDAQRFEAAPIAAIQLPHRVPPGFHGNWFPAA